MSDLEKGTSGKQRGKQHESQGEQRPGLLFPVSMKYLVQEVMGNSLSGKREKVMDTHTHTHTPHWKKKAGKERDPRLFVAEGKTAWEACWLPRQETGRDACGAMNISGVKKMGQDFGPRGCSYY